MVATRMMKAGHRPALRIVGDPLAYETCVAYVCQFSDNCDDFNDCTTETCNTGVCDFVNVSAGTSCEDGLFCTTPDTCDGAGTCVGGPNDPCLPTELCIEFMDTCNPQGGGGHGT